MNKRSSKILKSWVVPLANTWSNTTNGMDLLTTFQFPICSSIFVWLPILIPHSQHFAHLDLLRQKKKVHITQQFWLVICLRPSCGHLTAIKAPSLRSTNPRRHPAKVSKCDITYWGSQATLAQHLFHCQELKRFPPFYCTISFLTFDKQPTTHLALVSKRNTENHVCLTRFFRSSCLKKVQIHTYVEWTSTHVCARQQQRKYHKWREHNECHQQQTQATNRPLCNRFLLLYFSNMFIYLKHVIMLVCPNSSTAHVLLHIHTCHSQMIRL